MTVATQKQKAAIAQTFKAAEKAALAAVDAASVPNDSGKLDMKNTDGEMLMCKFTLHKKKDAPDPLAVTVNEGGASGFQGFIKRGVQVTVPWFVILHLQNNVERQFEQQKDEFGKNTIIPIDVPAESFSFSPINPSPDNPNWLD